MKVAILAGGLGSRLSEETEVVPKPMVTVGERPILWHIMKHFGQAGFGEFCLALGYKAETIKGYFLDYATRNSSFSLKLRSGELTVLDQQVDDWTVHLLDTGLHSETGGRLKRMTRVLRDGTFFLTYGDGVADVDLQALLRQHRRLGKLVTLTAVRPPARFGALDIAEDGIALEFGEKTASREGWINGGFMVVEPAVLDMIEGDQTVFERDVLQPLAARGELATYRHEGFWQCMDTLRDRRLLEEFWRGGSPPWKTW